MPDCLLQKEETLILLEERNVHNEKLLKHLQSCKLNVIRVDPPRTNLLGKVLLFIFVSELVALYAAKKKKKKDVILLKINSRKMQVLP